MDREALNRKLAKLTAYRMTFDRMEDDLHESTVLGNISSKDRSDALSKLAALHSRIEVLVKELQLERVLDR